MNMIIANVQTSGGWIAGVEFPRFDSPDKLWRNLINDIQSVTMERSGPRKTKLRIYIRSVDSMEVHSVSPVEVGEDTPTQTSTFGEDVYTTNDGPTQTTFLEQEKEWEALENNEGEDDEQESK